MNEIGAMIGGFVRHLVTTFGGVLVTMGYTDDSGLTTLAGAAAVIAGIIWSVVQKRIQARLTA